MDHEMFERRIFLSPSLPKNSMEDSGIFGTFFT